MDWIERTGLAVGGVILGAVPQLINLLRARSTIGREERADTIREYQSIVKQQQADVAELKREMADLRSEHTACIETAARLSTEIAYLRAEIAVLKEQRQ